MRKLVTFGAATLVAVVSVFGARTVAHAASPPCYYSTYSQTHYGAVTLKADGNYVDETLTLWQIPTSGCTQWAGHDFGDTMISEDFQLGSAEDRFATPSVQDVNAFGWQIKTFGYGSTMPETGDPYASGVVQPNTGWNGNLSAGWATWETNTTLGGTDGDTNLEAVSPIIDDQCNPNPADGEWRLGLSDGAPGYWSVTELNIIGTAPGWYTVPYYNFNPIPAGPYNC
jgi:hypothetical protein